MCIFKLIVFLSIIGITRVFDASAVQCSVSIRWRMVFPATQCSTHCLSRAQVKIPLKCLSTPPPPPPHNFDIIKKQVVSYFKYVLY